MEPWKGWRRRAKDWKKDNRLDDADIAAKLGVIISRPVERSTVNSWLNKREPNLSDFMALCEAMAADPGFILFEQALLKVRKFKQKKSKLRRTIIKV